MTIVERKRLLAIMGRLYNDDRVTPDERRSVAKAMLAMLKVPVEENTGVAADR